MGHYLVIKNYVLQEYLKLGENIYVIVLSESDKTWKILHCHLNFIIYIYISICTQYRTQTYINTLHAPQLPPTHLD